MLNNVSSSTSFDSTDDKPYPLWFVISMWILTVLFSLETIFGNLLVLWAYRIERNIRRQLSNKFIVSLAISDLIIGMEGFPILTVYVLDKERWPLGVMMCKIWLCIDYTLCLVSILTVLLITIDRYCSVCYPAKYRMWQSPRRITIMIITSWISPMALFSFMIFAWELMTNEPEEETVKCYAPFLNNPYVNMSMYIVYYWTTLIAMSILYRGIHIAAKALEERSKAKEKQTLALMLGQRCMAQVGVGMFMNALVSSKAETDTRTDTGHQTPAIDNVAEYTEMIHDSGYITVTTPGTTLTNDSKCRRPFESIEQTTLTESSRVQVVEPTVLSPSHSIVDSLCRNTVHNRVPSAEKTSSLVSRGSSRRAKKLQNTSADSMDYCDNISCNSLFADPSITSLLDFDQTLSTNLHFIEEENSEESSVTLCGVTTCIDAELEVPPPSNDHSDNHLRTIPPASYKSVPNALSQSSTLKSAVSPGRLSIIDKNVFTDMSKTDDNNDSDQQESSFVVKRRDSSTYQQQQKRKSEISSRGASIHLTVPRSSIVPTNSRKFKRSTKKSKDDWRNYRESWQSCLSNEDRDRLTQIEMARLKKVASCAGAPPDDEDSGDTIKQEVMSSNEEESSSAAENSRRIGWLSGLFANPTWLLTRRRKVTKAEKRARKAFRTITVIVGTFAMFWSPYYIVATVYGFCAWCVPPALFFTSYYLCYLNSSMNPFAYAFANRLFRKTFIRILRGDWRNT